MSTGTRQLRHCIGPCSSLWCGCGCEASLGAVGVDPATTTAELVTEDEVRDKEQTEGGDKDAPVHPSLVHVDEENDVVTEHADAVAGWAGETGR